MEYPFCRYFSSCVFYLYSFLHWGCNIQQTGRIPFFLYILPIPLATSTGLQQRLLRVFLPLYALGCKGNEHRGRGILSARIRQFDPF